MEPLMSPEQRRKLRGHDLLPDSLKATLPPLYAQEKVEDKIVHIKFFHPQTVWTWFVTEGQQEEEQFMFFGYVIGHEKEWGYFSLESLEEIGGVSNGRLILPVERELYFKPTPFSQVRK
jgi:hypothetical protein